MIGHELQPPQPVDSLQPLQEVGQADGLSAGRVLVAVDRLAQERRFQAPLVGQAADFVLDFRGRAALLRPAHPRHDAVGAELVAAQHDPHHRLEGDRPRRGRSAADRSGRNSPRPPPLPPEARSRLTSNRGRRSAATCFEQGRQAGQLPGAHHQVDVRRAAEDIRLVLLRHAAQHADDRLRTTLLELLQAAQGAVHFVLGVLTNAARVEQDGVGARRTVDQLVAGCGSGPRRSTRCPRRSSGSRRSRCRRVWSWAGDFFGSQ